MNEANPFFCEETNPFATPQPPQAPVSNPIPPIISGENVLPPPFDARQSAPDFLVIPSASVPAEPVFTQSQVEELLEKIRQNQTPSNQNQNQTPAPRDLTRSVVPPSPGQTPPQTLPQSFGTGFSALKRENDFYAEESLFYSEDEGEEKKWSDVLELGPFRFFLREVPQSVKAMVDGFISAAGQQLGIEQLVREEIAQEQEEAARRAQEREAIQDGESNVKPFKPLSTSAIEREVAGRLWNIFNTDAHRLLPGTVTLLLPEKDGELISHELGLGAAYDALLEEQVNTVLYHGLVKWECKRAGVPPCSPQSIRDLKLKIKLPVRERILSLSNYGAGDRFFRRAGA